MINTVIVCSLILALYIITIRIYQKLFFLNKYKMVIELLHYFLELVYPTIYNDQLITYTSAGMTKVQKDELETIERNFVKLTFKMLGENNIDILCKFYGSKETLISNILIYFRQKLEGDQVAKLINMKTTT